MARICASLALVAVLASPAAALDPRRPLDLFFQQSWQVRDGLPQNTIEAILQTRDGYLWLATQEGLVRFDGARFEVFDRGRVPGMTTNHVTALLEARDGTLWAGTVGGGLLRWQGGRPASVTSARGSGETVTALAEDAAGRIWVATQNHGIDVLEVGRVRENAVPGLPSPQVRALLVARDGTLWAGTAKGLARSEGGRVTVFTTRDGLGSDSITALAEADGRLWAGTSAGLSSGDGASGFRTLSRRDGLSHDSVRALHADGDGCLWIGTAAGGLNRWHAGALSSFTSAHGLTSDVVAALHTSRDGSLWIGTDGGGLNRLREGRLSTFGPRQGLANEDVYTVAGSRHGVLAGSYQGDVDLLRGARFQRRVPGRLVGSAQVRALLEDAAGVLWIGTDDGLWRAAHGRPLRVSAREGGPGAVRALAQDPAGTVWVGTDGAGLFRVERGALVRAAASLPGAQVRAILSDPPRGLWLGTYGGLVLLRPGAEAKTFTTADGLPHDYVRSLHLSRDGTLWIGTYGGGLSRYRDGRFVSYGTAQGLLSDVIYSILEDAAGDLWMSCNRGIFTVARRDLEEVAAGRRQRVESRAFDESDGMTTRECNGGSPAAWRAPDGRMWFATLGGVVMVDPARMAARDAPPAVVIERAFADGAEVADRTPARTLSARPRRLEVHYAGLSFVSPERVRYRYRLEGYDPDWVEAGAGRSAQYTGLPPGRYRFQVSARADDGPWNPAGASWEFQLAPTLHETPWFLAGAALLLGGAAFGLDRWRVRRVRRNEMRLQARIQEAVAQIKVLSGLIPICSGCKRIRDDAGYWEQMEVYIRQHSQAEFSHGLCPSCIREMYPEFADAVLAAAKR
jgi:ligand-binding sensor domain-containing protein